MGIKGRREERQMIIRENVVFAVEEKPVAFRRGDCRSQLAIIETVVFAVFSIVVYRLRDRSGITQDQVGVALVNVPRGAPGTDPLLAVDAVPST